MNGKFKGKTGKVLEVYTKQGKVTVEGIQVTKRDGSKANVKMQLSNLQIIEMVERVNKTQNKKQETKKEEPQKNNQEKKK